MKLQMFTLCLFLAFSTLALAEGQTDTDCLSMAESTERENPENVKKLKEEVIPKPEGSEAVAI